MQDALQCFQLRRIAKNNLAQRLAIDRAAHNRFGKDFSHRLHRRTVFTRADGGWQSEEIAP